MLTRRGHRMMIDRETNITTQLRKELFIDPRSRLLVAFLWISTGLGIKSVGLRPICAWVILIVGVAGFRPRLDCARLSLPIGYQRAGVTPRALPGRLRAQIAPVRTLSAGRSRGRGTTGMSGRRGVAVCSRIGRDHARSACRCQGRFRVIRDSRIGAQIRGPPTPSPKAG